MNKPNIIIVMADQMRADLRKGMGFPLDTMPFLDQWACGGIEFARAYTPNPTCMPARVSMLTGRYSQSHRVRTNFNDADALYTTDLLDILKQNGYRTALFGKNHSHRANCDFDVCMPYNHGGYAGEENRTEQQIAFADFLSDLKSKESMVPAPGGMEVQHPYRCVSDALAFMDSAKEEPFFAWVSFPEPHPPYQVPEPYFSLFPPETLPEVVSSARDINEKGMRYQWCYHMWQKVMGEKMPEHVRRARSNYLGMMRLIDDQFCRLIKGIEERNLMGNTIIVFLADHGDFAGEYGLTRKGPDLSQVLCRIPMIWRGTGIAQAGKDDSHCVNLVDLLPTVCNLLDVPLPVGCQGKSLLPLLRNEEVPEEEYSVGYSESGFGGCYWTEEDDLLPEEEGCTRDYSTFDTLNTWTQSGQVRMIRWRDYTLQMDMMGNGYLYNLKKDPFERHNLYGNEAFKEVQGTMLEKLAVMMLRAADPLPLPRRRYWYKRHKLGWWDETFFVEKKDPNGMGEKIAYWKMTEMATEKREKP